MLIISGCWLLLSMRNPIKGLLPFPLSSVHMSTNTQPSPEWLQDRLQSLLNSPYIHFNQPKLPHIRMGHGPVDLFTTRFNNWFTSDATGVVAGSTVDKAGLKDALLALQRKWDNDSATFTPSTSAQEGSVRRLLASLSLSDAGSPSWRRASSSRRRGRSSLRTSPPLRREYRCAWVCVVCSSVSSVSEEGGSQRISTLTLDGDASLFTN